MASPTNYAFKFVHMANGRMVVTTATDLVTFSTVMAALNHEKTGHSQVRAHRSELQGQPSYRGVAGPMYDGVKDGVTWIRYEDSETNDRMSR